MDSRAPQWGIASFLFLGKTNSRTPFEHKYDIIFFFPGKKNIAARSWLGLRLAWFPGKSGTQFTSQAHTCLYHVTM